MYDFFLTQQGLHFCRNNEGHYQMFCLYFSVPTNPSDDLLGLNFFGSSASTPTGGGYNLPSPMSPMSDGAITNSDTSAIHNTSSSE